MSRARSNTHVVVASLVGAVIGFLAASLPGVTLKREVTPAEGANFFLNIALVIIVPTVVAKAVEMRKRRGDGVAAMLERVIAELRAVYDDWDASDVVHPITVEAGLRMVRRYKQSEVELARARSIAKRWLSDQFESDFEVAEAQLHSLWSVVTNVVPKVAAVPSADERADAMRAQNAALETLVLLAEELRAR